MGIPLRTLIVEDSENDALLVVRVLQKGGYDPAYKRVETADAMGEAIGRERWDIILSDYSMPHFSCRAALALYKEKGLDIPFIIVSGTIGEEAAVAAMVAGAHDYVMKHNLPRLVPAIQRELGEAESRRERKRAEEALSFSNVIFRTQQEASIDGILLVEEKGEILSFNHRFSDMWGIPSGAIESKSVERAVQSMMDKLASPEEFQSKVKHLYENRNEICRDEIVLKDGRIFDRYSAPLIGAKGKYYGRMWNFRDVTGRKQTEEMKRAREIAEAASRAKSAFLANMSHELRTPLNSINGFSEILCDETFGPLNEKQKKYVNNILVSGKHLLFLINQILDLAQIETGKMKLALSSLPMKSLIRDISMLVADMASEKKIDLSLEIAEDLPNIEADELKVKEIIYNLLSNAVKFTPEGGKIGMRAKKADSGMEIVVWDTGIGIATENIEKIFEEFFRVDTAYSRVTEGTGLGLPLSRKLVELHGGKLSIESAGLNKGTSVRFTLPVISRKVV